MADVEPFLTRIRSSLLDSLLGLTHLHVELGLTREAKRTAVTIPHPIVSCIRPDFQVIRQGSVPSGGTRSGAEITYCTSYPLNVEEFTLGFHHPSEPNFPSRIQYFCPRPLSNSESQTKTFPPTRTLPFSPHTTNNRTLRSVSLDGAVLKAQAMRMQARAHEFEALMLVL